MYFQSTRPMMYQDLIKEMKAYEKGFLLALEGVVLHRAGAGTADVVAFCGGAEDTLVACVVGTPAQVHILKVGEEVLVKGADLLQNALAK